MQFKMSAAQTQTPNPGEDTARRTPVTPGSWSACEDDELEQERLFRTTFERAAIGIAQVSPEGRWLRFNQRLCDILGYSREELAKRTFQDITHPDDLADSLTSQRRLLAGELDTCEMDKRYLRMDGTLVWGHLTISLVRTPAGAPDYFITMVQDITERKRLEQERAELLERERSARAEAEAAWAETEAVLARAKTSEAQAAERAERLNTILETMTDGVAVYDAEGRPVQVMNRAYRKLYGIDHVPVDFETLGIRDRVRLLHVRDAIGGPLPFEDTPAGRALRGEVVTGPDADIRVRALDGRELEVNNSAAPLREPDGRITGIVLLLRDMTERNRLEREREAARADERAAREANLRLEQFLATAAHDLRTPLSTIVGYLDLAQRQTERLAAAVQEACPHLTRQVAAVRGRLADADQGADRLAKLLSLLFDTAAMRAGRLELHRTPHDLAALVRECVAALRVAAPDRSIRLHVPTGDAPIPVEADAARIGQVITNFVTNALKYSPQDQPVDVSVLVRRGRAHVTVCDRGPGIPKGEQARVWELFHRVPGVTAQSKTENGSLGLGLHICKAIIQAHDGRVGVKSAVGQGSTFWFTLPLSAPMPDLPVA